jgi:hypothetical protein
MPPTGARTACRIRNGSAGIAAIFKTTFADGNGFGERGACGVGSENSGAD